MASWKVHFFNTLLFVLKCILPRKSGSFQWWLALKLPNIIQNPIDQRQRFTFVTGKQCHLHGIRVLIGVTFFIQGYHRSKEQKPDCARSLSLSLIIYHNMLHISYIIYLHVYIYIYHIYIKYICIKIGQDRVT